MKPALHNHFITESPSALQTLVPQRYHEVHTVSTLQTRKWTIDTSAGAQEQGHRLPGPVPCPLDHLSSAEGSAGKNNIFQIIPFPSI